MKAAFLSLMMSTVAPAQPPAPESPLVYVKVIAPAGARVTFHPGTPGAKTLTAPAIVGVRPGYIYRLELALPQAPNLKLFPSLEVRGALRLTVAQAMRHPIPVVFHADEIGRVERLGAMITKVHYLEDPSQAAPIATTPDEPLILDVPNDADPLQEARFRGRPMIIVRLGEREATRDELVRTAVPNTILFEGEPRLALPTAPPVIPWLHLPVYDPLIGAKRSNEECLPDGGDIGPRVGIGPDGKLGGLDASDTAIEYTTEAGKRRVAVSNRVCVLVPRYAVLRQEIAPLGQAAVHTPGATYSTKTTVDLNNKATPGATAGHKHLAQTQSRQSPHAEVGRVHLHGFDNIKGVQLIGMVEGVKIVATVKEPDEITAYPFCEPISLFKWSEPKEARVGDVVTFYLRYHNHTKQFVDNLAVSDSLTGRLEYIPGSARSDRETTLTVTPNEAGSVVLRWELSGKLPPGATGIVAFQVKIR